MILTQMILTQMILNRRCQPKPLARLRQSWAWLKSLANSHFLDSLNCNHWSCLHRFHSHLRRRFHSILIQSKLERDFARKNQFQMSRWKLLFPWCKNEKDHTRRHKPNPTQLQSLDLSVTSCRKNSSRPMFNARWPAISA